MPCQISYRGSVRVRSFVVNGSPMGKPRMTRSDKWRKRDVVLRYRQYADRIREACGPIPEAELGGVVAIVIHALIAMPDSWSERKKAQYDGTIHRQKPDYDNIAKAVGDALLDEDSTFGCGVCTKFWCRSGSECTRVSVLSL